MLFLAAAVLAFPATAAQRAAATLLGCLVIQAVNLVRIVTLYLLGCHRPEWFETFHVTVWQTVVFAVAIAFFVFWTRRVAPAHVPQHA